MNLPIVPRKWWAARVALLVVVVLTATAFLLFQWYIGPRLVRRALRSLITDPCRHCVLQVGEVSVSLLGPVITVTDINFTAKAGEATLANVRIPELSVRMYPLALFRKKLHLGAIEAVRPEVIITERREKIEPGPGAGAGQGTSLVESVEVEGISVVKGDFSYMHEKHDRMGVIQVHDIMLGVEPFGSTPKLLLKKVFGRAEGMLENSGRFELRVDAVLFGDTPDLDVELRIRRQNLAELNPFFIPEVGVDLKGLITEGESRVEIRGTKASSVVTATFEKLEFDVRKTPERSAFTAFLSNVMAGLKMGGQNLYDKPEERKKTATLEREADETIIAYILRAMKEAALKIPGRERN